MKSQGDAGVALPVHRSWKWRDWARVGRRNLAGTTGSPFTVRLGRLRIGEELAVWNRETCVFAKLSIVPNEAGNQRFKC